MVDLYHIRRYVGKKPSNCQDIGIDLSFLDPDTILGPQYLNVQSCGKRGKERYSSELGVYHQSGEYHNEKPVWSKQDGTMKIYYSYGKFTFTEMCRDY